MMSDYSELRRLAEAATPQDFDSAQCATHEGWIECPTCGGEGSVDLGGDYLNYDGEALGVQFYGIGDAHINAEAYYRAANPAAILALIAENAELRKDSERLNFIESQNHRTLRFYKKRWSFEGFTNYEYSVFKSLREAIDSAMGVKTK